MHRPALVALVLALLAPGCSSGSNPSEKGQPSPLPYGYREPARSASQAPPKVEGEELDEIVAVVWGQVLTRRRLVREIGPRAPGQDESSFRKQLAAAQLRWAQQQLFVKAAEQEGIQIPSAYLDEEVTKKKAKMTQQLSKNTGRPVTWEEYLAQQHTSDAEFRDDVREDAMQYFYLQKLRSGLGRGSRPQVDFVVSPAEVRRLYREQPELFDAPQEVTFAIFQLRFVDAATGDVSPADAEAATRAKAAAVAAAFRAGEAPAAIARRFALDERDWKAFEEPVRRYPVEQVSGWLFDPARRAREATVIEPERAGGPVVVGLLSVTPREKRTYDESYDKVVAAYREGRALRLANTKLIEMVQGGAVAWPEELANAIVDQARDTLQKLDADPVLGKATFR